MKEARNDVQIETSKAMSRLKEKSTFANLEYLLCQGNNTSFGCLCDEPWQQVHDANATKCAILSSRDKSLTTRDTERQEPCEDSFNHKAQKGQNKLSKPANM
jgi:hypothetical protein